MKNIELLNSNIKLLKLDASIVEKLNNIDICKVEDLWKCTRTYLKNNKFTNNDILEIKIKIKLQLYGLDLNRKLY